MRPKFLVPFILVVFLAGSAVAMGQDRNEKKINRIMRKIEKQNKKLRQLNGGEYHAFAQVAPLMDLENIQKIREEAMVQRKEAMEQQREALLDQREAMRNHKRQLEEQMSELKEQNWERLDRLKDRNLDKLKEKMEMELEIQKNIDMPGVNVNIPEFKSEVYSMLSDQNALSIDKTLDGETNSADFSYEVKTGTTGMNLNVNGSIDSGKVVITIRKPDGTVFNEYTLSPLANVNWHQTLKFEGEEESANTGKWTVTIAAENAKGKYGIQMRGR